MNAAGQDSPMIDADSGRARSGPAALPGGAGRRVLVVEDNEVLLEAIKGVFEARGLEVITATTGEAALGLLREHGAAIDWLLTDIRLPGVINGWTVADEYRLSHPLRPVVYASTAAQDRRRTVAGSIFVEKPIPLAEIGRLAALMSAGSPLTEGLRAPGEQRPHVG